MSQINDIISQLPEMKSGQELLEALTERPEYDEKIREEKDTIRLMETSKIRSIYVATTASVEIYSRLYLALIRSLQKKMTKEAIEQRNRNYQSMKTQEYCGDLGGEGFSIIAPSGYGKTSAINRATELISGNRIICINEPYCKIIPFLVVQTPHDCSTRGLCLEILRCVDMHLGSSYYNHALKMRATTDMLIGCVSQVALNNLSVVLLEEFQNASFCKPNVAKQFVGALTQLINNAAITIVMVCTPECNHFFRQEFQLARRSLGLQYNGMDYNEEFKKICRILFSYQYVQKKTEISEEILDWLYEHSAGGIISVVSSLIYFAQELAIINQKERLDLETLNDAYKHRLFMLHDYISDSTLKKRVVSTYANTHTIDCLEIDSGCEIKSGYMLDELINSAKTQGMDVVEVLQQYITIEEVII